MATGRSADRQGEQDRTRDRGTRGLASRNAEGASRFAAHRLPRRTTVVSRQELDRAKRALEANRAKLSSRPDLQTKTDEMLVSCSTQTDNPELRLTTSRRLLDKNSLDVEARRDYAEALAGAGQFAEAIGEYEQILRLMTGMGAMRPTNFPGGTLFSSSWRWGSGQRINAIGRR